MSQTLTEQLVIASRKHKVEQYPKIYIVVYRKIASATEIDMYFFKCKCMSMRKMHFNYLKTDQSQNICRVTIERSNITEQLLVTLTE